MMYLKSKIIWMFCAIGLGMAGCLPDPLNVKNVPVLTPHMVVSSQVIPGQSIAVLLTSSISALDAGSSTNADTLLSKIVVNDASVTISYGNRTDTLLFLGDGFYGSVTTDLVPGRSYTLAASSPSLGNVASTTVMNAQVRFDSLTTNLFESGRDTLLDVAYSLTDPPGTNWYMVDVQRIRTIQRLQNNLNPRVFIKVFSDADFPGEYHEDKFSVPFRRFSVGDTVAVVLANISEEYYNYLKDGIDGQNSISDLVSEPLNFPTNVENGYGFFNLQVPDVRVLKLE